MSVNVRIDAVLFILVPSVRYKHCIAHNPVNGYDFRIRSVLVRNFASGTTNVVIAVQRGRSPQWSKPFNVGQRLPGLHGVVGGELKNNANLCDAKTCEDSVNIWKLL
jgi:hypothetical protein